MGARQRVAANEIDALTPRQRQVLDLVAAGKSNPEIAEALGVTLDGAKYHVREILGKLHVSSREEAVEVWRESRSPLARRALLPIGALLTANSAVFAAVAITVAVAVVGVSAWAALKARDGAVPLLGIDSPTVGALNSCDPATLRLVTLPASVRPGLVRLAVSADPEPAALPCRIEGDLTLKIVGSDGTTILPAAPTTLSLSVPVGVDLEAATDVAYFDWSNWCGDPLGPTAEVEWQSVRSHSPLTMVPLCAGAPSLELGIERPDPSSPPGLDVVVDPVPNPEVWIYEDAQPVSDRCVENVAHMIPAGVAGQETPRKLFRCTGDLSRLAFAEDRNGYYFLDSVEVLLLAGPTLPQPTFDSDCRAIVAHLWPASEAPEGATYILVCDARPLPRGEDGTPVLVWAQIESSMVALIEVTPGLRCWELSRFLGPPGEAVTEPVSCYVDVP